MAEENRVLEKERQEAQERARDPYEELKLVRSELRAAKQAADAERKRAQDTERELADMQEQFQELMKVGVAASL